ncbi:MAG TPA: glycosyltransferase family 9 protein [Desulfobacteraceae bacterium]|nr:glycosyltransferase family 9 protein [Desulfobacteraceae bacterium]
MKLNRNLEAPQSILIIKLSAIGDVVHSLPVLEVLRNSYPGARIDWVVEEAASGIIEGNPAVDEVIVSPRGSVVRSAAAGDAGGCIGDVRRFIGRLRSIRYDLVIDLQGLLKSGIVAGLARGRRKVGMSDSREGAGFFLTEPAFPVNREIHAVDRYLSVAAKLGCDISDWDGSLPVTEADRENVGRLLHAEGVGEAGFIAVNPVAKWGTKLWIPVRFSRLCDRIAHEVGYRIVFTGGGSDAAYVEGIVSEMNMPAVNLAGRTSLRELASIYERAGLLVTTDTGPMHIAAAMKCPVVALFGPTSPVRTGPYGTGHRVVRSGAACSPCFKKKCADPHCMSGIGVDNVFEAVKACLIRGRS